VSAGQRPPATDEWYTPEYVFRALGLRFDMDVCSPKGGPRHVPCAQYITPDQDGLVTPWRGLVWMNPPYGGSAPGKAMAVKRAWLARWVAHGNGIALIPDRTSAPWWHDYAPRVGAVLFMMGKIKFERPDGSVGKSPGDGSALLAMGDQSIAALRRASGKGLGSVFTPIPPCQNHAALDGVEMFG
jgi:hypothetical protein